MAHEFDNYQPMKCPRCGKEILVDSVRQHRDGKKRVYWECNDCKISVMDRGGSNNKLQAN